MRGRRRLRGPTLLGLKAGQCVNPNSREAAVPGTKSVLVIGLDPSVIDFSQPGYAPGMNATKVLAGLKSSEEELISLGYRVQMCLTDFGETAEAVVRSRLEQEAFDC